MALPLQIKASVKLQQRLRKVHLTARQMVFADLLAIGYEPRDAYQLAGLYDSILMSGENWKNMRHMMETNDAFNNYIPKFVANKEPIKPPTKKKKVEEEPQIQEEIIKDVPINPSEVTDEELANFLSKDNQLKELYSKLKNEELDIQSELKIRQMIADITNAKKEQTIVEDKRILFYMPLKCFQCSLYIKEKNKKKKP